ncbi:hypothetical protein G7Z17_g48 [Cylindrodendrum hubeiense]|uniref:Branched-chain-amino-acid aminotransferase n=1 Tax=Cylindrodendrum hubeiense TaxID=595255 RepID=A0A9P5HLU5_9HYPO|nr:hypothetical protein G7Z17_g48 [Cylindrodendrum hubeiense]
MAVSTPAPLDSSKLETQFTQTERPLPDHNSPEQWSQSYQTDHMLTVSWDVTNGWETPKIGPYSNLSLPPTASIFHYATTCFEGMKVYRGYDGKARLFRPHLNAARMLRSAQRVCLPSFDPAELEVLLIKFAEVEAKKWVPESRPGTFFYLRPMMLGTQSTIGLQPAKEALLCIISVVFPNIDDTPVTKGPIDGSGETSKAFSPLKATTGTKEENSPGLKLFASASSHVRAWPGGSGAAKIGANYGPTLVPQQEARNAGFDQVLWLYGGSGFENNPLVTEAGGSNFFMVWKTPEGKTQLITATLELGIILPGITRQSILELSKDEFKDELEVVESDFGIEDIVLAHKENRLVEAFVAGTAYFVTPVKQITYQGNDLRVPLSEGTSGKYTKAIREYLMAVQYGQRESKWGVVLNEL